MTTRERIAERLRERALELSREHDGVFDAVYALAHAVTRDDFDYDTGKWSGFLDDLLGVPEPTIEDVEREARRVYGEDALVRDWTSSSAGLAVQVGRVFIGEPVVAPTITATYAALRTLPTKGEM